MNSRTVARIIAYVMIVIGLGFIAQCIGDSGGGGFNVVSGLIGILLLVPAILILSFVSVDKKEKNDTYTRREFSYMSFQRSFTIPETMVDGDKINASYNEGILHISLPKKEEVKPKPARQIKIS